MSATLKYRPAGQGKDLPDELKYALRKRYDGTIHKMVFRKDDAIDMAYLAGLRDAGVKGADVLLEAIEKHSDIEVWEQY